MSEWISVKDRMPKDAELFLTIDSVDNMDVLPYSLAHQSFMDSDSRGYYYPVKDITHWMPLPEPPEEVKKDV